jgi:hypothetical protein
VHKEKNPYRYMSTNFRWWEMGYEEAEKQKAKA